MKILSEGASTLLLGGLALVIAALFWSTVTARASLNEHRLLLEAAQLRASGLSVERDATKAELKKLIDNPEYPVNVPTSTTTRGRWICTSILSRRPSSRPVSIWGLSISACVRTASC